MTGRSPYPNPSWRRPGPDVETLGGVVLLHGILGGPRWLARLGGSLRGAGYATWTIAYPARGDLDLMAGFVAARWPAPLPGVPTHAVGHSMGGIVARAVLDRSAPPSVGRLVTLGTPHGGSTTADVGDGLRIPHRGRAASHAARRAYDAAHGRPAYPFASIAAALLPGIVDHDGTVSVRSTRSPHADGHAVVFGTHVTLLFQPDVAGLVARFLGTGSLAPAPGRGGGR